MDEPERAPAADAVAAGALAVAAAAVLLSLFMRWYRVEATGAGVVALSAPADATGWELFALVDVVVAASAALGLALALLLVSGARLRARVLVAACAGFAAALGLVVWRSVDPALRVVAGSGDVVPAAGAHLALAGLVCMLLAAAIAAVWRT